MAEIRSDYGRTIDNYLSKAPTEDSLTDGLRQAGDSLTNAEKILGEAWTIDDDPSKRAKVANKLLGTDKYTEKNAPTLYGLQSLANQKYEVAQRSFAAIQKIKDRAHELMMEVIRAIGR